VLFRQHLGGSHQGTLPAGIDGAEQGGDGHHGLARTHVPLHQAGHRLGPLQVRLDFSKDPLLSPCEDEREQLLEPLQQPPFSRTCQQFRRRPGTKLTAALQQSQLEQKKFIEHQAATSLIQLLAAAGRMDAAQRLSNAQHPAAVAFLGAQWLAPEPRRRQGLLDQRTEAIRCHPLGQRIDGQQAADGLGSHRGIGPIEHFDQRIVHRDPVPPLLDQPADGNPGPDGIQPLLRLQRSGRAEPFSGQKPGDAKATGGVLKLKFQDRQVGVSGADESVAPSNGGHDRGRLTGDQSLDATHR